MSHDNAEKFEYIKLIMNYMAELGLSDDELAKKFDEHVDLDSVKLRDMARYYEFKREFRAKTKPWKKTE